MAIPNELATPRGLPEHLCMAWWSMTVTDMGQPDYFPHDRFTIQDILDAPSKCSDAMIKEMRGLVLNWSADGQANYSRARYRELADWIVAHPVEVAAFRKPITRNHSGATEAT